jgi:drug/metabolite transporter (DMT)-like permease
MSVAIADPRADRLTLGAFAVVVLLGGTNFVAVRFSNQELPPFWGASLRFAAASLVLFAAIAIGRFPLPRGRALAGALVYGVLGFGVTYAMGYWALRSVPAGTAAVVLASAPLFTVLLAWLHGQQGIHWRDLAGAGLALLGIAVMFRTSADADLPVLPLLGILVMAVCFAEATVAQTWIALAYLALLGSSAGFVLYLYVLKRWSASAVANQFVLFPLVAIVLAAWLERAPVTGPLVLGAGIVLAGVYVGVISQPAAHRPCPRMGSEPCLGTTE